MGEVSLFLSTSLSLLDFGLKSLGFSFGAIKGTISQIVQIHSITTLTLVQFLSLFFLFLLSPQEVGLTGFDIIVLNRGIILGVS